MFIPWRDAHVMYRIYLSRTEFLIIPTFCVHPERYTEYSELKKMSQKDIVLKIYHI